MKKLGEYFAGYWRWTTGGSKWRLVAGIGGPILALLIVLSAVSSPEEESQVDSPAGAQLQQIEPTATREPAATPEPTATRTPPTPTPIPEPVVLSGRGQTATEPVRLPSAISVATFTHSGWSNFIVQVHQGSARPDLLINVIGNYNGARPLTGSEPIIFDIDADGAWTIRIEPIGRATSPAFEGVGDAVSGLFDPPSPGAWEFFHDGRSNFIVRAHCGGGTTLVQNEIGAVSGSRVVTFRSGPCTWEVRADGNWRLAPR
jgi:hypothetical protein